MYMLILPYIKNIKFISNFKILPISNSNSILIVSRPFTSELFFHHKYITVLNYKVFKCFFKVQLSYYKNIQI